MNRNACLARATGWPEAGYGQLKGLSSARICRSSGSDHFFVSDEYIWPLVLLSTGTTVRVLFGLELCFKNAVCAVCPLHRPNALERTAGRWGGCTCWSRKPPPGISTGSAARYVPRESV